MKYLDPYGVVVDEKKPHVARQKINEHLTIIYTAGDDQVKIFLNMLDDRRINDPKLRGLADRAMRSCEFSYGQFGNLV